MTFGRRGSAYYVFMHPYAGGGAGGWIVIGSAFDSASFTSRVNEGFGGMDVRVVNRKVAVAVASAPKSPAAAPAIPVVISSGSQEDEIAKIFGGRPYSGFLSKPFTLAELKSVLASVRRTGADQT